MPRQGTEYHVDDVWRVRIRDRLRELHHNQSWLAEQSGCPRSMISELLSGKRSNTTYLPEIHAALDLPPPVGPLMSRDEEEIVNMSRQLEPEQRAKLYERFQVWAEERKSSSRKKPH